MNMMEPVIVECAINGARRPGRNPHLPIAVGDLVDVSLRAFDAGAAVVHQHDDFAAMRTRDAQGMAELSAEVYRGVLAMRHDALLYPTANFAAGPGGVAMWEHHELLAAQGLLRIAVFDPGAVSLAKADRDGVPRTGIVYAYSPEDVAHIAARCHALRLGPNITVFDVGFLRTVLAYHRAGALPPGAFVKLYFGGDNRPVGLPPTERSLDFYLDLMGPAADELAWAVGYPDGDVVGCGLAAAAITRGGHVRVGLEDYAGPRTPSNAELVAEVAEVAAEIIGLP